MRSKKPILIVIMLFLLLNFGCSSNSTNIQVKEYDSAENAVRKPIQVAIVPPGFTSPFHSALKDGAVSMAKQINWNVDIVAAENEGDFAGQVAVVEQELQKGISAISINPIDAKAIVTAVREANIAGIPVFMHNLITPVDEGKVVEYVGYDQWNGAAKMAGYTCQLLKASGNVYILTGISGFHANRRSQGYRWGLQQSCPNVQIVGEQTAEWDRTKAIEVATIALQQNPKIDVFYGNSDEMAIGACIAAAKIGRKINQDIWCLGIDGNAVTLDLIKNEKMTATLGVYPDKIGATIITQMEKLLNGENIPYILQTPSIVVDKNNVDDYENGTTWIAPTIGFPEMDNGKPTNTK
jgi:ABC-type sugar transport system substrate-binding protein